MEDERHEAQEIGRRLREAREARHMSRQDVAGLTGVSVGAVQWMERQGALQWVRLANLADFYGLCPGELFGAECGEPAAPAEGEA